jgi:uncharacterized cupin superfamily protein
MANLFDPHFDVAADEPGFAYRRARLGRQAGAERLGASLYELEPGQATFPYHAHSANEEMLIVVCGRPSLRTAEGWRELAEGEIAAFPVGDRGTHQVMNRSGEAVRVLIVSEMVAPEVLIYPDSGKLGAATRAPGATGEGGMWFFRRDDAVGYFEGEPMPGDHVS